MITKVNNFILFALVLSFTLQAQKTPKGRSLFDSIPDRDNFKIGIPLNAELTTFFKAPYNIITVDQNTGRLIWDCRNTISPKPYWHKTEGKTSYGIFFSCNKDRSPFMISNFYDSKIVEQDDALIEVYSSVSEPLFKRNDFIGQKAKQILERFGNTFIKRGNYLIYHNYTDKILVFYFSNDRVTFYRYSWLNKPVTGFEEIDKGLLKL